LITFSCCDLPCAKDNLLNGVLTVNRRMAEDIPILIRNRNGSVEHYFHFLLGYCIPLVHYFLKNRPDLVQTKLVVRSCGPLTHILGDLPINLRILPKEEHSLLLSNENCVELYGFDLPQYYSNFVFTEFRDFVQEKAEDRRIAAPRAPILLIEREAPHPFYGSDEAEIKFSGAARRVIKNHQELASWLIAAHPEAHNIQLVGTSLYEQFTRFHAADLVIAQHGAALGNILFMKEGSRVLEIGSGKAKPRSRMFEALCATMRLKYFHLAASGEFLTIETGALADAIEIALHN
jgi:Glycosyltransferase 61